MKYAIYCRVSTRDQDPGAQRREMEAFAQSNGWDYEVFEEVESSRKTRPIKAELLRRLRAREFDGVAVYSLSRWARSSTELSLEVTELYEKGIVFVSKKDSIDLSTASGKLMFQIFAAYCEFERSVILERTLCGLAHARAQGKVLGRPKGSIDKKVRRRSGYLLRYANKGVNNGA